MAQALITVARACELVLEAVSPLGSETVGLDDALDRVLAQDVRAAGDVPPFASSAMDGYAIVAGDAGRKLRVVGESRAGTPAEGERELRDGEAIRISTGAAIPPGATAVIPQENVRADGEHAIETMVAQPEGKHVRAAGEAIAAGTLLLRAGARLDGLALGAAASAGLGSVSVARRPRVAVVCTGDELRAPGEALRPGEIHNSNAPMLTGLVRRAGAVADPASRLADDRTATEEGLRDALSSCDVLIISGGVSVGPHDHVKPALQALGVQEIFWSVCLQPGKPTWFGSLPDGRLVFGLPGNPVSAAVTFSLFAAPALAALQAAPAPQPPAPEAELAADVRGNPNREQAIRVRLAPGEGLPRAFANGAQGSHILVSLLGADALAMIPPGEAGLPAGATVKLRALAR
ncbi:MAG: molybdopterin molybdotransferase MoeA [Solirubrobacteraceae bacterium]